MLVGIGVRSPDGQLAANGDAGDARRPAPRGRSARCRCRPPCARARRGCSASHRRRRAASCGRSIGPPQAEDAVRLRNARRRRGGWLKDHGQRRADRWREGQRSFMTPRRRLPPKSQRDRRRRASSGSSAEMGTAEANRAARARVSVSGEAAVADPLRPRAPRYLIVCALGRRAGGERPLRDRAAAVRDAGRLAASARTGRPGGRRLRVAVRAPLSDLERRRTAGESAGARVVCQGRAWNPMPGFSFRRAASSGWNGPKSCRQREPAAGEHVYTRRRSDRHRRACCT